MMQMYVYGYTYVRIQVGHIDLRAKGIALIHLATNEKYL